MDIKDSKTWVAFDKYCEWKSLPRHMSGMMLTDLEEKGFPDEMIELLQLKYKKDFCEKFCININMLKEWDKHPEFEARIKKNWKKWTRHLTPGIMGKFYEKLMVEADPGRFKLWMEHVEEEGKQENPVNVNIGYENILKAMAQDGELKEKIEEKNNGEERKQI